jgi:hypothetical protein
MALAASGTTTFRDRDFDGHGLRCRECEAVFVEGQPIAERLDGIDALSDGEPLFFVTLICVGCSLATVTR